MPTSSALSVPTARRRRPWWGNQKATGRQTVVGGNISRHGLSEQAEDLPKDAVVVAELSSFQLDLRVR